MNLTLTNYPSYAAVHKNFGKRLFVFFRKLGHPHGLTAQNMYDRMWSDIGKELVKETVGMDLSAVVSCTAILLRDDEGICFVELVFCVHGKYRFIHITYSRKGVRSAWQADDFEDAPTPVILAVVYTPPPAPPVVDIAFT